MNDRRALFRYPVCTPSQMAAVMQITNFSPRCRNTTWVSPREDPYASVPQHSAEIQEKQEVIGSLGNAPASAIIPTQPRWAANRCGAQQEPNPIIPTQPRWALLEITEGAELADHLVVDGYAIGGTDAFVEMGE